MATFNADLVEGKCKVCGEYTYIGKGGRCLKCIAESFKQLSRRDE